MCSVECTHCGAKYESAEEPSPTKCRECGANVTLKTEPNAERRAAPSTDDDLEIFEIDAPTPAAGDVLFDAADDDVTMARARPEVLPDSTPTPQDVSFDRSPDSSVPIESRDFVRERSSEDPVTLRRPERSRASTATTRRLIRDRTPHPPRRTTPREASRDSSLDVLATRELPTDAPTAADAPSMPPAQRESGSSFKWVGLGLLLVGALVVGKRWMASSDPQVATAPQAPVPGEVASQPRAASEGALGNQAELPIAEQAGPSSALTSEEPATPAVTGSDAAGDQAPPRQDPTHSRSQTNTEPRTTTGSTAAKPTKSALSRTASAAPEPGGPAEAAFDANAANAALTAPADRASACRQADDPSGVAVVTLTFAPSGRVTSATISGPPFAGTKTGSCIASTLRGARVPAYEGEFISVRKTVVID